MNFQKHKTGVGIFVVACVALLIAGIAALGGGKSLVKDTEYVLYFDSSVSGLSIGSPVMLRGVPLGTVTRIRLVADANRSGVTTPVTIRINSDNLLTVTGTPVSEEDEAEVIRAMIAKGMRAQLQTASFLTGQTRIQLDFYPDTEAHFKSPTPLLEIPTIPSTMESLQKSLGNIPVDEIARHLESSLVNLNEILASGAIQRTLDSMDQSFSAAAKLLNELGETPKLVESILTSVSKSAAIIEQQTPGTMKDLRAALEEFANATRELHKFADSAKDLVAPDSALVHNLSRALKDAASAARSLKSFADTLDRNPESILRGRQGAY